MNYPVWHTPGVGGGLLIALVAVTHVFISHFAVGGGLYLVIAERMGIRRNSAAVLEFTRSHAKFFFLVTIVAGSVTGVGIWWIVSLVHPAATSILIHTFVFAWGIEFVFFLVEIVAVTIYFYTFGRMDHRTHQAMGWIYFLSSFGSLAVINGILGFMLHTGGWAADRSLLSAFLNPLYWPSLGFRTAVAAMLAGVWAFLTTAFLKDTETRRTMTAFTGKWVLLAWLAAIPFGILYYRAIPAEARALVAGASPTILRALQAGTWALAAIALLTLLLVVLKPSLHTKPVSFLVLASALVFMGSFEWTREAARRPYAINGLIYSNGIPRARQPELRKSGYLGAALWTRVKTAEGAAPTEAGREMFFHQCHACHTIGGVNNDIRLRTRGMPEPFLTDYIRNLHERRYFMPPFAGTDAEAAALAAFIVKEVHGKGLAQGAPSAGGVLSGRDVYEAHCSACHAMSGGGNELTPKIASWDRARIRAALDRLETLAGGAMPPLDAPTAEKDALVDFLVSTRKGGAK